MAKKDKKAKAKDAEEESEDTPKAEEGATEGEAAAEGEGGGKKSKKKIIIIVVLAVLLIAGGVAGAYFAGLFGGKEEAAEGEGGGHAEGEGVPGQSLYFELPEFLVNLNTGGRQTSFLKMTVTLELASAADQQHVQANLPRVLDSFNTYLRELRATDLYGSAGTVRLREELLARVNKELEPVKVRNILFKQLVIQ